MHFPCSRGQVPVADVVLYRIPENPCQIQKLSGFLLRLNETSGPVPDTNSGLMPSKSEFDEEAKMYAWAPLGCGNYAPNFFGTSVPEVVEVRENPDGTVTLTVNAVCDMVICDDALITHDLTVKFKEDGSFQYLGNEIRKEDRNNVPEYQYRVKGEIKNGS